jgi:arsenite-transporting ATPase
VDGSVAEELALLPGAEELTTLLAVERLAASGGFDHVVVDCAPTDATLRLTTLPDVTRGMLRVALGVMRTLSGAAAPVARHLISLPLPDRAVFEKLESLLDRNLTRLHARITHSTTSVRLVATPERMVIDEARRAYTELALFEVPCDAIVMNRLLPDAAGEEPFFADALRVQRERLREVEGLFDPLPMLEGPLGEDEVTGLERLSAHARQVFGATDPARVLCAAPALRFERDGEARIALLSLPGADPGALDVAKVAGDLIVSTPARRRALALPRGYAALSLAGAEISEGRLRVRFVREVPA